MSRPLRGGDIAPAAAAIIRRRDELAALPAHGRAPARALALLPAPDPPGTLRAVAALVDHHRPGPRHPARPHRRVRAVAFGVLDGRAVLASAGTDQTVRLWDPGSGSALGEPFETFAVVHAIAIHDHTIAVATSGAVIVLDAHATRT